MPQAESINGNNAPSVLKYTIPNVIAETMEPT